MHRHPFFARPLVRIVTSLVIALTLLVSVVAQKDVAAAQTTGPLDKVATSDFMQAFFNREEVKAMLTGAVVTVVSGGEVVLNEGFGYANVQKKLPVDPEHTLFRLASISKTFTATAVMQLAEQHKVDLNQDISGYLGSLNIQNRTGAPLTLKHLLTHSSGFDFTDAAEDEADVAEPPLKLDDYVREQPPTVVRKPGEAFRYDNYGYNLSGYIVQNVSGKPFETWIDDQIFRPLGMNDSSFIITPDIEKRLATPYDASGAPIPQYATRPYQSPDGGLISTGADMARFMLAQLNGGKLGSASILTEHSVQEMQRLDLTIHPDVPGVGYGFESTYPNLNNGRYVIDKGGVASGFQSHLWLLPQEKTGLFLALNSAQNAKKLKKLFYQSFMDRFYPKADQPAIVSQPQTKQQLQRLEGFYRDLRLPAWHYEVAVCDGGLCITDSYGVHRLKQVKPLLFVDEEGRQAAFKENGKGDIAYFFYNKADSWSEKLAAPNGFTDVPAKSPYAKAIDYIQQQGLLAREDRARFKPTEPITRAQFIGWLVPLMGVRPSEHPVQFEDSQTNPYAAEIQTALEGGVVGGTSRGMFNPDAPITRQEAAVIVSRLLQAMLGTAPEEAKLSGETDDWALEGVQDVVARGYFGPEVVPGTDGSVDYHAKELMLRQEAAAMLLHFP